MVAVLGTVDSLGLRPSVILVRWEGVPSISSQR